MLEIGCSIAARNMLPVYPYLRDSSERRLDPPVIIRSRTGGIAYTLIPAQPSLFGDENSFYVQISSLVCTLGQFVDKESLIQHIWSAQEQPSDIGYEMSLHRARVYCWDLGYGLYTSPIGGYLIGIDQSQLRYGASYTIDFPGSSLLPELGEDVSDSILETYAFTARKQMISYDEEQGKHIFQNASLETPLNETQYTLLGHFLNPNLTASNEILRASIKSNGKNENLDIHISRLNARFRARSISLRIKPHEKGDSRELVPLKRKASPSAFFQDR